MRPWTKRKPDKNENEIVLALRKLGASVIRINSICYPGCPDLIVGYQGATCLCECKYNTSKLRDSQKKFMAEWRGGTVFIIRDIQDVATTLTAIAKEGAR